MSLLRPGVAALIREFGAGRRCPIDGVNCTLARLSGEHFWSKFIVLLERQGLSRGALTIAVKLTLSWLVAGGVFSGKMGCEYLCGMEATGPGESQAGWERVEKGAFPTAYDARCVEAGSLVAIGRGYIG